MHIIPALGKLRQENRCELEASLSRNKIDKVSVLCKSQGLPEESCVVTMNTDTQSRGLAVTNVGVLVALEEILSLHSAVPEDVTLGCVSFASALGQKGPASYQPRCPGFAQQRMQLITRSGRGGLFLLDVEMTPGVTG